MCYFAEWRKVSFFQRLRVLFHSWVLIRASEKATSGTCDNIFCFVTPWCKTTYSLPQESEENSWCLSFIIFTFSSLFKEEIWCSSDVVFINGCHNTYALTTERVYTNCSFSHSLNLNFPLLYSRGWKILKCNLGITFQLQQNSLLRNNGAYCFRTKSIFAN